MTVYYLLTYIFISLSSRAIDQGYSAAENVHNIHRDVTTAEREPMIRRILWIVFIVFIRRFVVADVP